MENKHQPAFAKPWSKIQQNKDAPELISVAQEGLTKIEYVSAMAMQGLLSNSNQELVDGFKDNPQSLVTLSTILADELLKQLDNGK